MIAVDTECDEEILQELRARTFAATVQRLRKTAGLVVSDKVEIFYEDSAEKTGGINSVSAAMLRHSTSTVKRIKSLPLDLGLCSSRATVIIRETITDADISKAPITIVLTHPCIAVDTGAITASGTVPSMAAMYLQSMSYDRVSSMPEVQVTIDKTSLTLKRGVHYFLSANEMVLSPSFTDRAAFPNLPKEL